MGARSGEAFLRGLRDGRELYVDGQRVTDPTDHPALSGAARGVAELFDLQHAQAVTCLMPDPETGEPIAVSHMIPRSVADLERRHAALECVAEHSVGLLGRSPDYMNLTFAGFAGSPADWSPGNAEGAANLLRFQQELRRRDLSLTHTLIHPTVDKSQPDIAAAGGEVALHKVGETARGIVVRGARVLATLAPFADEIAVYPGFPLPPEASAYALAFSIPMNTPGLKCLCRDSVSRGTNRFDHPLSSRFDEQDAFVIFENVEVPRERLFIDANPAVYNQVLTTSWYPNVMQQTMIRAQTKLEFAYGLGCKMAEIVGDKTQVTAEMLGEMFGYAELARAAIRTAEREAYDYGQGAWFPNGQPLGQLRHVLTQWFPRVNEILRLIGSHNLLATPTQSQLRDPQLGPLLDKYLQGADGASAEKRIRVFRLAWDFAASALGSRNEQYERFYLGSGARNRFLANLWSPKERSQRLVERFLAEKAE
jgi:4-hydroxyphenylacetate 3-monooxygenase oxygenase component